MTASEMVAIRSIDAHEHPPARLRQQYKAYRALKVPDIDSHPAIIDLRRDGNGSSLPDGISLDRWLAPKSLEAVFDQFMGECVVQRVPKPAVEPLPVYTHRDIPGGFAAINKISASGWARINVYMGQALRLSLRFFRQGFR